MKENKESKLEGLHYEILMDYIDTGNTELIKDPEMIIYLEQLELCRRWYDALHHESKIIRALCLQYNDLTPRTAKSRYQDSMNYFYSDTTIKKTAYRNMAADKIVKAANLILITAKEPKDLKYAGDLLHKAEVVRGSMEPTVEKLPDHILQQRQPIFIMDPTLIGLEKADRNVLAKQIESYNIPEMEKEKIKQEAGVIPFNIKDHINES